jgi:uncharacterized protein YgfB (UPF0149 family)
VAAGEIADFGAVQRLLDSAQASWDAAEAHGAFCGRACLSGVGALQDWVADISAGGNPENVLAQEARQNLQAFAADTLLKLEAGQLAFQLLLPEDDVPLEARTTALADWCHGFMHGLACAGGADQGPYADALETGVVKEIIDDFSEITRAAVDKGNSNEIEQAYAELEEYVRVSAQLVYEETVALRGQAGGRQEKN